MSVCAVIKNGMVINMIMASPSDPVPYPNCELVGIPDNILVGPGYTYVAPNFYDHFDALVVPVDNTGVI